jgi:hypothetical protein
LQALLDSVPLRDATCELLLVALAAGKEVNEIDHMLSSLVVEVELASPVVRVTILRHGLRMLK